jgi:hypothetical protein
VSLRQRQRNIAADEGLEPAEGTLELTSVERPGLRFLAVSAERQLLHSIRDAERLVEACLSVGVDCALLYAGNLTRGFFDLSLGEAGAAVSATCSPKSDRTSSSCSGLAKWHWNG